MSKKLKKLSLLFPVVIFMIFTSHGLIRQNADQEVLRTEALIEAESGKLNGPMQRYSSAEASEGNYLMNHYTTTRRLEDPALQPLPDVSYTIDIPEDGDYFVWLRVKVPVREETFGQYLSLYIGSDDSNYNACIVMLNSDWDWQRVTNLRLKKGTRTLDFKHKDFGFGIDKLFITATGSDLSGLGISPSKEDILRANFNIPIKITYPP